jgi:hypothetical protein
MCPKENVFFLRIVYVYLVTKAKSGYTKEVNYIFRKDRSYEAHSA